MQQTALATALILVHWAFDVFADVVDFLLSVQSIALMCDCAPDPSHQFISC